MNEVKWNVIHGLTCFRFQSVLPVVSVLHQSLLKSPCTCKVRYTLPLLDKCHRCRVLDQIRAFTVEDPVKW